MKLITIHRHEHCDWLTGILWLQLTTSTILFSLDCYKIERDLNGVIRKWKPSDSCDSNFLKLNECM